MSGRLVHFELPADDTGRATTFWSSLLGWQFNPWTGPVEYHMTDANGEPGGAIYPRQQGERGPIVYFGVDDIDAALENLEKLGGSISSGKSPIPGVGWYAHCADTESNPFGLFQSDESVPRPG